MNEGADKICNEESSIQFKEKNGFFAEFIPPTAGLRMTISRNVSNNLMRRNYHAD
jgi:hypothetical protein